MKSSDSSESKKEMFLQTWVQNIKNERMCVKLEKKQILSSYKKNSVKTMYSK